MEEAREIVGSRSDQVRDSIVKSIYQTSEKITRDTVSYTASQRTDWDRKFDDVLTSVAWGFPIMFGLLAIVFWITLVGANIPFALLAEGLFWVEEQLTQLFMALNAPAWLHGFLVLGVYRCLAWVVSVMLPPMAIFFPLFTLLEDAGYLPRVAFNLDRIFKKVGAHGKQALTMCMGFGCNAAGIISCRIIDSPRERIIAALTNNFIPCNGRFPTLIALATIFISSSITLSLSSALATLTVAGLVVSSIAISLVVSWILSRTILKGEPSSFSLELPPYRKPQIGQVIVRSVLDRTIFVLARAMIIAAPAGGIIWIMANTMIGDMSILAILAGWLDPFARFMGLDGFILMAFILGLPANEIVFPILIMNYLSSNALIELNSLEALRQLLVEGHGWTWVTLLCTMFFSLCHWPCGTTLFTIQRELKNWRWTVLAAFIPVVVGIVICILINNLAHGFGLV